MNRFDFLSDMPLGQYLPTGSILHRLDARARILAYLSLIIAITFTPKPVGLALGLVVVLIGLVAGRIPLRYALRGLKAPLPFLLLLAVLQVFINPHNLTSPILLQWNLLVIRTSDLAVGGILLLRFSALILTLGLASFTLSTNELVRGLTIMLLPFQRLRLPVHDFVLAIQVTLRFLPLLAQTAEQIAKAQAARGADWDTRGLNPLRRARQVAPILIPLFISSLLRAEMLAIAMDVRGYGTAARTSWIELHFTLRDGLFLFLAVVLAGMILIL